MIYFLKISSFFSSFPEYFYATCCWAWAQVFSTLLTYVAIISFPVCHMMLTASAVLYCHLNHSSLFDFSFNKNMLISFSPAEFSGPKVTPLLLSIRTLYRHPSFLRPIHLYLSLNNSTANRVWDNTAQWLMLSKSWVSFPRLFTQSPSWVKGFAWYLPWWLGKQG